MDHPIGRFDLPLKQLYNQAHKGMAWFQVTGGGTWCVWCWGGSLVYACCWLVVIHVTRPHLHHANLEQAGCRMSLVRATCIRCRSRRVLVLCSLVVCCVRRVVCVACVACCVLCLCVSCFFVCVCVCVCVCVSCVLCHVVSCVLCVVLCLMCCCCSCSTSTTSNNSPVRSPSHANSSDSVHQLEIIMPCRDKNNRRYMIRNISIIISNSR